MTDLAELLARVESASGPDRELDGLLWAWQGDRSTRYADGMLLALNNKAPHDECIVGYVDPGRAARNFYTAGQTPPIPRYSASLDDAVTLCERVLPGWWWKVGTCSVSDDACVAPDFGSPEHGDRLRAEIGFIEPRSEFDTGFDVDRRPPGNVALALCEAILRAKIAIASRGQS